MRTNNPNCGRCNGNGLPLADCPNCFPYNLSNQQREGWEEKFFKEFEEPYFYYVSIPQYAKEEGMRSKGESIEWLKSFIKETLATERERVLVDLEIINKVSNTEK